MDRVHTNHSRSISPDPFSRLDDCIAAARAALVAEIRVEAVPWWRAGF
jgi:hypothetical protein